MAYAYAAAAAGNSRIETKRNKTNINYWTTKVGMRWQQRAFSRIRKYHYMYNATNIYISYISWMTANCKKRMIGCDIRVYHQIFVERQKERNRGDDMIIWYDMICTERNGNQFDDEEMSILFYYLYIYIYIYIFILFSLFLSRFIL